MDKMRTSGFVGAIAVALGLLGFFLNWTEVHIFGTMVASQTGLDLINGLNKVTIILILFLAGLLVSAICFIRDSKALRASFFILGLAIVLLAISIIYDLTPYTDLLLLFGTQISSAGVGLYVEIFAGMLLMSASLGPTTRGIP